MDPAPAAFVRFDREACRDPTVALRREWLVTNGLGGYASTALDGTPLRSYSGWLIAALEPPVARTVLVGAILERATAGGVTCELGALDRAGGDRNPDGGRFLERFELDGMRPVWQYSVGDALLEKTAWMAHGHNTAYVRYRVLTGGPVALEVTPLVTHRDHHQLRPMDPRPITTRPLPDGIEVTWPGVATRLQLSGAGARVTADTDGAQAGWVRGIWHRRETAQVLDDVSDLAVSGRFAVELAEGAAWTLVMSTEAAADLDFDAEEALAAARARDDALLERARSAGADTGDPLIRQLVLAADQFIVARPIPGTAAPGTAAPGRSVIAGYPWFTDWGRDTMISLPGLCLSTGRFDDAAAILRSFAGWVRDGLLPNSFPDAERTEPAYHAVDAPLWYVHAVDASRTATGDSALVDSLLPTLCTIVDHYAAGTRFGIGVDPADGLVRAGEPGVQLTWMDAKAGDWVVTPRAGKPVEIQALWIHACRIVARLCRERGDQAAAARHASLGERAATAFGARFWNGDRGCLFDVVDGPTGDDPAVRPNQLFAVSLGPDLLDPERARAIVDTVTRSLWVGLGLRSLAPSDPAYLGTYRGDRLRRDAAYHQGTAWTWLTGAYAEALLRTGTPAADVQARLDGLMDHLRDAGLGTVSECLEGDPPHRPVGCYAQAWGVAEMLRAVRLTA
jgi:predicted glycogen debranching enzyme